MPKRRTQFPAVFSRFRLARKIFPVIPKSPSASLTPHYLLNCFKRFGKFCFLCFAGQVFFMPIFASCLIDTLADN